MLHIENLHASVDETPILKGLTLTVNPGEIHAIMGPNGAGKSTLANVLAGHPAYTITSGTAHFENQDLLEMEPEDRARAGLFMSFQYPPEIPGVPTTQFLHQALNAVRDTPLSEEVFETLLEEKMALVNMPPAFKERALNEGFSGGEKKRSEILQMAVLEPKLAILDETDSGLDIDALRTVAHGVNRLMGADRALLIITHYQRLLDYIKPHFVHVLMDGKIVESGGPELALKLEEKGYAVV